MSTSAFRLFMQTGPSPGTVYELTRDVVMIGREVNNEIIIGDPQVSRQHARLTRTAEGYALEDLGSTNGTFVNSERLAAPRVLKAGDLVGLSENVLLVYEAVVSETEATVVKTPEVEAPAPAVEPPVEAPQDQPVERVVPPPAMPEPRTGGGIQRWALAGCGCLLVIVVVAAVLYWMPLAWWCLLLKPLEVIGLRFAGC